MLATVRVALPEGLRRLRVPREVRPIVCRPMQHELVKVGLTERATRAENIEAAASLIVREERHRRPVRSSVTERVIIDVELWQRRSNGWGRHRSGIAVASQWRRTTSSTSGTTCVSASSCRSRRSVTSTGLRGVPIGRCQYTVRFTIITAARTGPSGFCLAASNSAGVILSGAQCCISLLSCESSGVGNSTSHVA